MNEVVAEGFNFGGETEVFGAEEEGRISFFGGELGEWNGTLGKTGADQGVSFQELRQVGVEVGGAADRKTEEIAGGGADGFGVEGGSTFPDDNAGTAEGGSVADDGAEVTGVGNFGEDDQGARFEGGEGSWIGFAGDGEVAAMEMKAEEVGGLLTGEVCADADNFFDEVGGFLKTLDGELTFYDEVGGSFAGGEEGLPVGWVDHGE